MSDVLLDQKPMARRVDLTEDRIVSPRSFDCEELPEYMAKYRSLHGDPRLEQYAREHRLRYGRLPMAGGRGRYARGLAGAAVAATGGGIVAEIGGNTFPSRVQELGIFFEVGLATTLVVGRPGNTPTTGTANVLQAEDAGDPACTTNIYTAGWGTAPTVPATFIRRIALPATVGQGIVYTWPVGKELLLTNSNRAQGVLVWIPANSAATSTTYGVYVVTEE